MEWLYIACIVISGLALVAITLIIPLGVFMRYVMNNPLSWPEPASVIMMVMFSFLGGAAVYRANVHIAVEALLNAVQPGVRRAMLWGVRRLHGGDRAVHARLRHRSCAAITAVIDDGRVPVAVGRRSSTCRSRSAACSRCCSSSSGSGSASRRRRRSCTATRPTELEVRMDALVLLGVVRASCARSACRSPTRSASRRSSRALWVDIPLEAVMLKISDGTDDFALLAIPFFVLAGGIMAEGGMATRLINLARVFVGFIRGGLALVNILASTLFGCISGSSVADTASIGSVMIPQMVKAGYPRVFATNVTICGSVQALLIPPSHNAVIYSLAAGGTISVAQPVPRRHLPGAAVRPVPDRPRAVDRAQARLSRRASRSRSRDVPQIVHRRAVGPGHGRHHHGRHPVGRVHADRVGGGRVRLRLPRDVPRLSRLQVARAAAPRPPRRQDGGDGDDADRLLGRPSAT